ncbi:hypothetical protein BDZ97DRAFT_1802216 [Flammula alnicola]|nr:hypothetical protein BDZ97DRAFT_1802216 [Flammula alnicola]
MPRATKQATYDRVYLEGLPRTQIQALAKSEKIKANGKTAEIITQLLLKKEMIDQGVDEEAAPRTTSINTRADPIIVDALENDNARDAEPEATAIKAEPCDVPQSAQHSVSFQQARGTPSTLAPLELTDKDVRSVRRRLTSMGNEQGSLETGVNEIKGLLEFTQSTLVDGRQAIANLSWTRQSIEQVVIGDYKLDRTLWDGTGRMKEDGQGKDSGSDGADSDSSADSEEDARNASQELFVRDSDGSDDEEMYL